MAPDNRSDQPTRAENTPTADTLILLENEIALGRKLGMAGQTLGAMCSARDEIDHSSCLRPAIEWAAASPLRAPVHYRRDGDT